MGGLFLLPSDSTPRTCFGEFSSPDRKKLELKLRAQAKGSG